MKKSKYWIIGSLVVVVVAVGLVMMQGGNSPNKVIYGGTIYTMEGKTPQVVEAVAVSGDKIVYAGSKEEAVKALAGMAQMIDLKGKTMFPGFIEPHMHHALAGAFAYLKNIRADESWGLPGADAEPVIGHDKFLAELTKAEKNLKDPNEWLFVYGYASYYHGKIDRFDLEKISATRPILMLQRSVHEIFLNGKALKMLGFTAENTKGNPDIDFAKGHFVEAAVIELVFPKILGIILRGDRWPRALHQNMEFLHKNGVTTAVDMLAIDGFTNDEVKQFRDIIGGPDAPFRTYMVAEPRIPFEKGGAAAAIAYIDSLSKKDTVNLKYMKAVKGFVDGAFFAQLMMMSGGYTDGHQGQWITPPDELKKILTIFWNKSYPIHIHVNGDAGLDSILATISGLRKQYPNSKSRVTFHHLGYARPDQIEKMKQLGICASLLPYYLRALGDAYSTHGLGPDRATHISRSGTCLKNGIIISLHSDFPMAPANPLYNAWVAVTRIGQISGKVLGPEERISAYDAMRAITIGAAYTVGLENEIGSIKAGKKADFTILAEDPFKVDPVKMKDIPITAKVFNGKYYTLRK